MAGICRGHVGQRGLDLFDNELYLAAGHHLAIFNRTFAKGQQQRNPWEMEQVLAMAFEDDKDRFEFLVVEGSPMNEHFNLPFVPVKIRATQGHANALVKELPPTMLAKLIFCREDHKSRYPTRLMPQNPEDTPPRLYHRTWKDSAKLIIQTGLRPGGGEGGNHTKAHNFLSPVSVDHAEYTSGVRQERPAEICFSTADCIAAGVDLFLTGSRAIITHHHIPNTCILYVTHYDGKGNHDVVYSRPQQTPTAPLTGQPSQSSGSKKSQPQQREVRNVEKPEETTIINKVVESGYFIAMPTVDCPKCSSKVLAALHSCHLCNASMPDTSDQKATDARQNKRQRERRERLSDISERLGRKINFEKFHQQIDSVELKGLSQKQRGASTWEARTLEDGKNRLRRALKKGYENVYDRFMRDDVFAQSLAREGSTDRDAAYFDLLASLLLPRPDRTMALGRWCNPASWSSPPTREKIWLKWPIFEEVTETCTQHSSAVSRKISSSSIADASCLWGSTPSLWPSQGIRSSYRLSLLHPPTKATSIKWTSFEALMKTPIRSSKRRYSVQKMKQSVLLS